MKRNPRSLPRLFLCATLCVILAGCGAGQTSSQPSTAQSADSAVEAESAEAAKDADQDSSLSEEAKEARARAQATNYDYHMDIWEHPAGFRTDRKADEMNISDRDWLEVTANSSDSMIGAEFHDVTEIQDSFYNGYILGNGLEKETFEDIPYVIPYLVRNAFGAVIVIPGGGFYYKTMNGHNLESHDVAVALNAAGYSAFVLNYRSNPYEYPIPQLDVQRAVRFVRSVAEEYEFPADNIGVLGYSAGAFQAAYFLNELMGNDRFPDDYKKDNLDAVDDTVQHAAFIYPMFDFRHNVPMLCCLFDVEQLEDEASREAILDETDMTMHFTSKSVPQFVAYGINDRIVGVETSRRYLGVARNAGASIAELCVKERGHLFEQEFYMDTYLDWLRKQ